MIKFELKQKVMWTKYKLFWLNEYIVQHLFIEVQIFSALF